MTICSCPLHALASFIAVVKPGPKLFTFITESNICSELNSQLQTLTNIAESGPYNMHVTPNLTSHSIRAGAATAACDEHRVKEYVVNRRGDWARGQDTSIIYKRMTLHSDGAIGRVLSFWPHIDIGGRPPERTETTIRPEELEQFKYLTFSLLGTACLEADLAECLCCVLLMHYEEVLRTSPSSILIERIDSVGIPREKLLQWGGSLKHHYQLHNSLSISLEHVDNSSITENLEEVVEHLSSD